MAIERSCGLLYALNPQSRSLAKRAARCAVDPPTGSADGTPDNAIRESQGKEREGNISFSLRSKDARTAARGLFERWYEGYPHKVGRGAAEKAFARALSSGEVTPDELIAGRDRYIRTKNPEHPWCNPATWLNQKRWLDQPASSSIGAAKSDKATEPRHDFGGGYDWPETSIRLAVRSWREGRGRWPDHFGSLPGQPGCQVPKHLLEDA